jgi:hypothetical protein
VSEAGREDIDRFHYRWKVIRCSVLGTGFLYIKDCMRRIVEQDFLALGFSWISSKKYRAQISKLNDFIFFIFANNPFFKMITCCRIHQEFLKNVGIFQNNAVIQ